MPLNDSQRQVLVGLTGYVTPEFLELAKLVLRVYGIPFGDLDNAKDVSALYWVVKKYSTTSDDALSMLQFVLQMVGVDGEKVKQLGSDEKCLEACRTRSKFSQLVYRLCAGLSEDDCTHLKSLASDHIKVHPQSKMSRVDLFQRCISQDVLREDDMEFKQFKEWLGTLGRNDLVREIDTYISGRSKEAPAPDSNSQDKSLEPTHIYNIGAPSNLVSYTWFHGNTNRQEAEKRLCSVDFPCFLVRPSEKFKESLSLSMKDDQGTIFHYQIIRGTGWYEINGTFSRHSSLPELVSYFRTHSVTNDPNHMLHFPCPKVADSASGVNPLTSLSGLSMSSESPKHGLQELHLQQQYHILKGEEPVPVVSTPKLTWKKSTKLPVAMSHPQVVRVGNTLYAGGGYAKSHSKGKLIMAFNVKEELWSTYCKCPTVEFGLTQLNGKLVVVGGVEDGKDHNSPSDKVYVYIYNNLWFDSQIPPFKTARFSPAAFSYESNLIVAGGGVGMDSGHQNIISTPSVEVYCGATGQWNCAIDLPALLKQTPGTVTARFISNDHVYLLHYDQCMSIGLSSLVSKAQSTNHNQSEAQESTPPSSSWKVLPCPLKCSGIAVVSDKLIAVGGRRNKIISNAVHIFDHDSWGILENGIFPEPNYYATIALIDDGKILALGGSMETPDGSEVIIGTCYVGSLC